MSEYCQWKWRPWLPFWRFQLFWQVRNVPLFATVESLLLLCTCGTEGFAIQFFWGFLWQLLSFCLKTSTEEANQSVCKCIMLNVSNRAKVTADSIYERLQRGSFVLSVFGVIDKVSPDGSGSSGRVRGGGRETWNLCGRLRRLSFLWPIFTGPGGPWPPRSPPRIRYCQISIFLLQDFCCFFS